MNIRCTNYSEHAAHEWKSVVAGDVHCQGRGPSRTIELPRSMHVRTSGKTACIRTAADSLETLCGKTGTGAAEFVIKSDPQYVNQHCLDCRSEFCRTHDGYTPVTY
ncbi:hypothetical protein ACFZAM_31795 [Streptomyces sp. NPDC008079]|uniref:hypothetical protein n=1 Tax=Streptomyces sp. NPDC008079 TaxID=3364806 RepID=UPI0036E8067E